MKIRIKKTNEEHEVYALGKHENIKIYLVKYKNGWSWSNYHENELKTRYSGEIINKKLKYTDIVYYYYENEIHPLKKFKRKKLTFTN